MAMPPSVPQSIVAYVTGGVKVKVCSVRGNVVLVRHRHEKENSLGGVTQSGGGLFGVR